MIISCSHVMEDLSKDNSHVETSEIPAATEENAAVKGAEG